MGQLEISYTSAEEISKIRASVQAGFRSGKLKSLSYRKTQLLALARLFQDNQGRFQYALQIDLGRPPLESSLLDINGCIREAMSCYRHVDSWTQTERAPFDFTTFALGPKLRKEPKGCVLIIGPFNFPLWCLFSPLAGAIAAGNAAVLKPSVQTPATSALLAELMNRYLDPDLFRVVLGAIPETTELLALQWDHVFFTGGGHAGRIVATAAARHLTPVTLELGGKCPVIVDSTCDLPLTCRRILWGKTANAGQICTGPDYVLIAREFQDAFLEVMKDEYRAFFPEGPFVSKSFSRIVGDSQFDRIKRLLDATKGTVILGGDTDAAQRYIAPTIVRDVTEGDSLMSEELFAPILPIVPVADLDEAIAFVNARDHPLALYLFTSNEDTKFKVLNNTLSGSVGINDVLMQVQSDGLPFGGVGPSGWGAHTGKFGFDTFTHLRPYIDSPWYVDMVMWFRFPPYTDAKHKSVNKLMLTKLPSEGDIGFWDAVNIVISLWLMIMIAVLAFRMME